MDFETYNELCYGTRDSYPEEPDYEEYAEWDDWTDEEIQEFHSAGTAFAACSRRNVSCSEFLIFWSSAVLSEERESRGSISAGEASLMQPSRIR